MKDDDNVDAIIAEGWAIYDDIAAKWADLVRQQEHLSLYETLEMVQQGGRSDDLPSQSKKTEIVGNVIYPSVFKYTK
jgi:hypothetical protein